MRRNVYRGPRSRLGPKREDPRREKLKPGADSALKKVFAAIGVPRKTPFRPDPYQLEALSVVDHSDCLVTAPTGSGKTWIALRAMERILSRGGRAWYASPLKALSNSKYAEFTEAFGPQQVGILTGDRKENPDAPMIVGTTEILRNQLYDAMHRGESLAADLVVLDEAHFLGDEERGVVWEEIMIYLPARIPILMLSATIGNAGRIAQWLSAIRSRKCIVVEETQRPVPLFPLFLHPSGTLLPLLAEDGPKGAGIHKKVRALLGAGSSLHFAPPGELPQFGRILQILKKYRLLPAIFFMKSRADCDGAVDLCRDNPIEDSERRDRRKERIAELLSQSPRDAGHRQLDLLEDLAVAAHHSGQLPSWKLLVETLMTEGLLDAVFATSTVAAGVNFPARTVVFLNSDRFNGREFVSLTSTELHQMTGRAGRRGMDRIGFAVIMPGKFMNARLMGRLFASAPSAVESRIRINFSMVLNLLLSHAPGQIENLLEKSFAAFQRKSSSWLPKGFSSTGSLLRDDFRRHLLFLREHGYATAEGGLTDEGVWASRLRVDQPILIAEGFRQGLFPGSDPALLAGIMGSFVNERESDERIQRIRPPKPLLSAFVRIRKSLVPISRQMTAAGFQVRPLFLRPAAAIHAWASGRSWEEVISISETAEGDIAMLVLRTADHLRHIRSLENVFPEAARSAEEAIRRMLRDPVMAEARSQRSEVRDQRSVNR